ncbi:hypothetical protein QTP88_003607 [Uroleucon formosanum]
MNNTENDSTQQSQVRPKIPPTYVYNISDYENFHTSLENITFDNFSIVNTKSALKINLNSIDDYRTTTKLFDETEIEYHTYQLPENKQLSVVIRNLPVNISEACIYNVLQELKFELASVTRLQNQFKSPTPIVAVLLSKSSTEIFFLNRLLYCVVIVEPRKPSKDIPQCTNCQRFSHTKKFCHLPLSPGNLPHSKSSLIRRKDLAKRTWQNHRNPANKKKLNLLTKEVQMALKNNCVSSYNSYSSNMRPGESNLWKATKRLLNQEINTIPPLRTDAKLVISDQEKCDVFSNMLYNTFSPNHICNPSNDLRVKHTLELPNYEVKNSINYVTPYEIKHIIKNLPSKISPGHDKITNLMLKKLSPKGLVFMTTLFNSLLRLGYFPLKWKVAIIILINKPGKKKIQS